MWLAANKAKLPISSKWNYALFSLSLHLASVMSHIPFGKKKFIVLSIESIEKKRQNQSLVLMDLRSHKSQYLYLFVCVCATHKYKWINWLVIVRVKKKKKSEEGISASLMHIKLQTIQTWYAVNGTRIKTTERKKKIWNKIQRCGTTTCNVYNGWCMKKLNHNEIFLMDFFLLLFFYVINNNCTYDRYTFIGNIKNKLARPFINNSNNLAQYAMIIMILFYIYTNTFNSNG